MNFKRELYKMTERQQSTYIDTCQMITLLCCACYDEKRQWF